MQLEDNTPMFSKNKMILKNLSDLITHAAVSNDYLVLAMANGNLFRLNLKKPDCGQGKTFAISFVYLVKLYF